MNKENAVAKINKYGKIGKIITIILLVFAAIGTCTTIVSGIFLFTMPEDFMVFSIDNVAKLEVDMEKIDSGISDSDKEMVLKMINDDTSAGFNLGVVRFHLDKAEIIDGKLVATSNGNDTNISMKALGYGVVAVAVALLLAVVSLIFAIRLCKAFEKCETPFEENVIKKMRQFAIALFPWAIYSSAPEYIMRSVLKSSLEMNINIDMNIIFTVLVIFALSTVFKYGAELQRESDETL